MTEKQPTAAFVDQTPEWCKTQCERYRRAADAMTLFASQSTKDEENGRLEIRPGLLRCLEDGSTTDICGIEGSQMTIHYFTPEELAARQNPEEQQIAFMEVEG